MAAKINHKAHQHVKLPGCGCKCCYTPKATVAYDPEGLAEFHAYIHAVQAAHAARPRLAGDGLTHPYRDPWTGGEWSPGPLSPDYVEQPAIRVTPSTFRPGTDGAQYGYRA